MKREKWDKEYKGVAYYDNDANDYYYSWVDISIEDDNICDLEDLFEEYLEVNGQKQEVIIKARKGAIFIYKMEKE